LEATKLVLNAANGEGTAAALDSLSGALIAASSDKAEGVASFKEKRKPNFQD
jgi:1,4-dihydroxy-2-naphthoyl-CoA synthase